MDLSYGVFMLHYESTYSKLYSTITAGNRKLTIRGRPSPPSKEILVIPHGAKQVLHK